MTSVLIVGSGAREHALAWKLSQSTEVTRILAAPGNPGIGQIAQRFPVAPLDVPGISRLVREQNVDLTIIGPEAPLAMGLADALRLTGHAVVGPSAAAARIESSKSFAKVVMGMAGVPTAAYRTFDDPQAALDFVHRAHHPLVVKADGLAGGKGVVVCHDVHASSSALNSLMSGKVQSDAARRVLIEEILTGPEVSLLALVDGERCSPLPICQDHKRLLDGDAGPNTGGMGAYAPYPFLDDESARDLCHRFIDPVVAALKDLGAPYCGILYAGLMLTEHGPMALEYNCRFGDPETQALMPLLAEDLLPWLWATATGELRSEPGVKGDASLAVVLAASGYPENPVVGTSIHGLETLPPDVLAFHAGTEVNQQGELVTAGGRVLTLVATGRTVVDAAQCIDAAAVRFEGMQRRTDIGLQARPSTREARDLALLAGSGAGRPASSGVHR
ncbi:MAG: phosphoribosylamine--glycine ligase [Chloroflexota bacterium]